MLDDQAAGVRSGTRWSRLTLDDCPTVALTALRLRSNWIAANARRATFSIYFTGCLSPTAAATPLRRRLQQGGLPSRDRLSGAPCAGTGLKLTDVIPAEWFRGMKKPALGAG
jgi:hypothetical protein